MTTWQPIETAPKDGTLILGWSSECREMVTTSWARDWCEGSPVLDGRTGEPAGSWCEFSGAEFYPTHWQPLPPPPDDA